MMKSVGLDIGTNYTKAVDDKQVISFPSIVVYGEEKEWSLTGENKEVYVGEEALAMVQSLENIEATRPLHEGRIMNQSYMELARHALKMLDVNPDVIAAGMPVKSSKNERKELSDDIKKQLNADALIYPEPAGTLAQMNIQTGVSVDIGFGTTDIVVLSQMEFIRGDTLLLGVDWLYDNLEVLIRKNYGINITPEEITKLLTTPDYELGRIRSGKTIKISHDDVLAEYNKLIKNWLDRIVSRTKLIVEGLSTDIIDKIVLTGGGSLLPRAYEEFESNFEGVAQVVKPKDPVSSNALGYLHLTEKLYKTKTTQKEKESVEETKQKSKKKEPKKKEEIKA